MIDGVKYNTLIKIGRGFFSGYRGKITGFIVPETNKVDFLKPVLFEVCLRENFSRSGTAQYDYGRNGVVHISEIEKILADEEEMMLLEQPIRNPRRDARQQLVNEVYGHGRTTTVGIAGDDAQNRIPRHTYNRHIPSVEQLTNINMQHGMQEGVEPFYINEEILRTDANTRTVGQTANA